MLSGQTWETDWGNGIKDGQTEQEKQFYCLWNINIQNRYSRVRPDELGRETQPITTGLLGETFENCRLSLIPSVSVQGNRPSEEKTETSGRSFIRLMVGLGTELNYVGLNFSAFSTTPRSQHILLRMPVKIHKECSKRDIFYTLRVKKKQL